MQPNDETESTILSLVNKSFKSAWEIRNNLRNDERSSYFVSELSKAFRDRYQATAYVQETDQNGKKKTGEWLLDAAIVKTQEVSTPYKNRKTIIVGSIIWAIESEFSTNIHEFCKDFTKLIHIKACGYLYVAGLDQSNEKSRDNYIEAQHKLAFDLVKSKEIHLPFFIVFMPTPGKGRGKKSIWDEVDRDELESWFKCFKLNQTEH